MLEAEKQERAVTSHKKGNTMLKDILENKPALISALAVVACLVVIYVVDGPIAWALSLLLSVIYIGANLGIRFYLDSRKRRG
jgi:hypothetical protein